MVSPLEIALCAMLCGGARWTVARQNPNTPDKQRKVTCQESYASWQS
jgi:hypothetical protein